MFTTPRPPRSSFHTGRSAAALLWLVPALLLAFGCAPSSEDLYAGEIPERVDFNFHVKPILSDRCFACHGPDENAREADLRLDTEEGLRRVTRSRFLRPGELLRRVLSGDPDEVMPPSDSHLELSTYEKAILARWVEQGAEYRPHWAFLEPERPEPPSVRDERRVRGPIDRFVLARLEREGLEPSPEASREVLIRRVTYDLTGLPPTPAEVDAFLKDRASGAYERVVDRLLASPAYGERMALDWLDLARYADSHGYQDDGLREMWPWRDWVVEAFNRNLPYDEFVTWQLAGDLLPGATREQVLATAFNRNHPQNSEGGAIPEEFLVEYAADRTNTFGKAFLGLTLECARCHDHKYDPVSQQEYYQLLAFFNNVDELGLISNDGNSGPLLPLPTADEQRRLDEVRGQIARLEREIRERRAKPAAPGAAAAALRRLISAGPAESSARFPLDRLQGGRFLERGGRGRYATIVDTVRVVEGRTGSAAEMRGDGYVDLGEIGNFDRSDPFTVAFWTWLPGEMGDVLLAGTQRENLQEFYSGRGGRGYGLYVVDGRLAVQLSHQRPHNLIHLTTADTVPRERWVHVAVAYDGSSRADGVRLYLNGRALVTSVEAGSLYRSMASGGGFAVGRMQDRAEHRRLHGVRFDELALFPRPLTGLEVALLAGEGDELKEMANRPESEWPAERRRDLREVDLYSSDADHRRDIARLRQLRQRETELLAPVMEVMVMAERKEPKPTYVLDRGAYDSPAERVRRGTPASVLAFREDLPPDRLGLARWLFEPGNPLTARVAVNRYWHLLFGTGLVKTLEDFGNQGALPSHPELLDWLAVSYQENGWDTKALLKEIVTSATYRQSSRLRPELAERDPENRLLARGPSHRLPAEMVRDGALAASGLLVREMGGPSVKPYQPAGLWEEKASGRSVLTDYVQDHGDKLYRRSLYTFWKRSSPPPAMTTFDAVEREVCTVRRQRTNTPLQALVLLNDPQFVEAARLLAERMIREGGDATTDRIRHGFRLVTARTPSPRELDLLESLHADELAGFRGERARAAALLQVGEHPRDPALDPLDVAAYTVVANALLNLDEAVTKR